MKTGLTGTISHEVTHLDTASAMGSGDVAVLATPKVVALCEAAALEALKEQLEAEQTTVGARISIDHLAPTVPGRTVTARASLERVDGRTLEFAVQMSDGTGEIATGLHVRVIVDRQKFAQLAISRK